MNDSNDNDDIEGILKLLDNTHLDKLDSASSKVEEAKELLILECSKHIDMARAQRFLYQSLEAAAVSDAKNGVEYSKRRTTLTVDFGQNIQVPCYNSEQPGCTYYYTPITANNFGIVNHSHDYRDGNIDNHMYCHVYHEGVGKKGGTNVTSLIVKTLRKMQLLRDDEVGGELNIIFDNCSGQNKNNTVLKLGMWLKEMNYFKRVNFVFLIVGHTKNACDRLFNSLKHEYRKRNIFTMDELIVALSVSDKISVDRTIASDFLDYNAAFREFYNDLSGLVLNNHIFTCDGDDDKLAMTIRESNLDEHQIIRHTAVRPKRGFANDIVKLRIESAKLLQMIQPPGINPYKQVELYAKYRPVVPQEYHQDEFYIKPTDDVLKKVKEEKVLRTENRAKVKALKEEKVDVADINPDAFGVKKLKVPEIKEELKRHGLRVDGKKAELMARLEAHLANALTNAMAPESSPTFG